MKGIAHFLAGVAAATFVPGVVESAVHGSFLIVLGGLFGLLPDTLDFKFARYFEQAEAIEPEAAGLDPQAIANQLAAQLERAAATQRPVRVQLHTLKLGPNRWQQYTVRFDPGRREIAVRRGPIVNTSQVPVEPADCHSGPFKTAPVKAELTYTYDGDISVDIFNGPSFAFVPKAGGVEVQFLPWHRAWSHSLTLAAGLGLIVGLIGGSFPAGLIAALGLAVHILEDQLGHLGSNLFWPLTHERTTGLRLIHAGDALPNFLAGWVALQLIFFNLDRFSAPLQNRLPLLEPVSFLTLAVIVPAAGLAGLYARGQRAHRRPLETAQHAELVAETQETVLPS